jgi:hypothetical protein
VIGLTVIGLVGVVWFLHKKYLKAKKDTRPLLIKIPRIVFLRQNNPGTMKCRNAATVVTLMRTRTFLGSV